MDARIHPAVEAIETGNVERLRDIVHQDPTLATSRSSTSHPTLLQCLVLSARDIPNQIDMAKVLIDAGADLDGPLVACGSCDNVATARLLLDSGAAVNGCGGWSPLEEALYWNSQRVIQLLLSCGASIHNLRIAAGLGRTDLIEAFFDSDGSLKPNAGPIDWPWGHVCVIETNDRQSLINNAFVYACMHGRLNAASLLLEKGAQINAIPKGFDYAGTGLHYAALNGHRAMVEFLLGRGADPNIKDEKVAATPAGWADYAVTLTSGIICQD